MIGILFTLVAAKNVEYNNEYRIANLEYQSM